MSIKSEPSKTDGSDFVELAAPLPRSFYERSTLVVARELLGKLLVKKDGDCIIISKIVEDEAYGGQNDPASHAYKGKTPRNEVMFGKPGLSYVYFVYGNHYCLNATTEREGIPGAVLIRAIEIIHGLQCARKNRPGKSLKELANGPGKLTRALGIIRAYNRVDLTTSNLLFICKPEKDEGFDVVASKRIGIKAGSEKLWRFCIDNSEFLSK
ncbi:DNA-3-methyladenine glycosylase [Candidatus Bathyarchaeota archaeon]|nr:DNA-3-methyladenine glycosylase [Candidatus Bathyarchaeota archaeon]